MNQWTLALLLTATCGCSVVVDGAIRDPADSGVPLDGNAVSPDGNAMPSDASGDPCMGMEDGASCGTLLVCIDGECVGSECGDAVTDPSNNEDCDDGDEESGDGCENDCTFSCDDASDCDDGLPCTGTETCGTDHVCAAGVALGMGDPCAQPDGMDGICRGSDCVAPGCGDGVRTGAEECDDGDLEGGDGCEADCTFTCETDPDCDDGSVCTGTETCDVAMHTCVPGTTLACDDSSPCTRNECDAATGCVYPLIDMDMDGHAPIEIGTCGTDCNDMRRDVNPDAVELCGDALNSDCRDGVDPTSTPIWYRDCDNDEYAALGAVTMTACSEPPGVAGCTGWTTRVPITGDRSTYDCNDANANVRPGQATYYTSAISGASSSVDYDYDCDLVESREIVATSISRTASCTYSRGGCIGVTGWTGTSAPSCGASAEFSSCRVGLCFPSPCTTSCFRSNSTRTQACR